MSKRKNYSNDNDNMYKNMFTNFSCDWGDGKVKIKLDEDDEDYIPFEDIMENRVNVFLY
jgi:hypothetical protein